MSARLCPSWCRTPAAEHEAEAAQGVSLIHGGVHATYPVGEEQWGFSVERHEEPDGRLSDVLWIESDTVEVGDAEALARAILAFVGVGEVQA